MQPGAGTYRGHEPSAFVREVRELPQVDSLGPLFIDSGAKPITKAHFVVSCGVSCGQCECPKITMQGRVFGLGQPLRQQ